jgi:hypothetical protein
VVKGSFKGIVRKDVEEPAIEITGSYDTVYYGTLSYFVLVFPANAEIEYMRVSDVSDIIVIHHASKRYCFKMTYGDAYFPDKLTPVTCP